MDSSSINSTTQQQAGISMMDDDDALTSTPTTTTTSTPYQYKTAPDRTLEFDYMNAWRFWGNSSNSNSSRSDFDSQLQPVEDVSVDAVLTSVYFNTVVFLFLMASYEILRRLMPTVYSSRKKLDRRRGEQGSSMTTTTTTPGGDGGGGSDRRETIGVGASDDADDNNVGLGRTIPPLHHPLRDSEPTLHQASSPQLSEEDPPAQQDHNNDITGSDRTIGTTLSHLPDDRPLDWIKPILFGVPWSKVRKVAGLDGYFFLRYIRMNVRICAVSTFWFFLVLVPIYATGGTQEHQAKGWYHLSAANIPVDGWRMWMPIVFAYLFSAFIVFVIRQEYRHFLELRQNFLTTGTVHVNPQHHYSLIVERVPLELRSDRALKEYFEKLFPGRVHSASVVLNLPDLEKSSRRCFRTCRRLEKSIAYLQATGKRPEHSVGRWRIRLLGVDVEPLDLETCASGTVMYDEDTLRSERPEKGSRVDSITYYTHELAEQSRTLYNMQQQKTEIAASGNQTQAADGWFHQIVQEANAEADRILEESEIDNHLGISKSLSINNQSSVIMPRGATGYGSFAMNDSMDSIPVSCTTHPSSSASRSDLSSNNSKDNNNKTARLVTADHLEQDQQQQTEDGCGTPEFVAPFGTEKYRNRVRRFLGRSGLDFLVAGVRFLHSQVDWTLEGVMGSTMSSTGFVTLLDLSSTTFAASAPLTVQADVLEVAVAPNPAEIQWPNAHVSKKTQSRRETIVTILLILGVVLWSFPLAAIQAFAKAEFLAQIPGMEWILTFQGGSLTHFVNGYLPVVALLCLIIILPVIFEYLAVHFERRKTFFDIQSSMLGRYFYYQLANIYISVTAGSLLKSLNDILNHPSLFLELLGESLPTMVGYFVALLITKLMVGLPSVFLRFGALSRTLFLKCLSKEKRLTQRELDTVFRYENVQYGWEFPTQLLVVVIVFTYAIICPIILPVGLLYFIGALIVYKKQILYVYSPVYESGGMMFPIAAQKTLFALVCGQLTLWGYILIRGCVYQPAALFPLPIITIWTMNYCRRTYVEPSQRLSLERAREYDSASSRKAAQHHGYPTTAGSDPGVEWRRKRFDKNSYRQPVLTETASEPMTYRGGVDDPETIAVRHHLRKINRRYRRESGNVQTVFEDLPEMI